MINIGDVVTLKNSRGQPPMRVTGVALRKTECGELMLACNYTDPQTKLEIRADFALRSLIPWEQRRKAKQ